MNKVKSFKEFINESAWGEMRHRSSGKVIRKENLYHTVFGTDISVENYDYDFNKTIKTILNDYYDRSYEIELGIAHSKDRGFTPDEMVNVRKWLAPYDYLIYDGLYGTDLVAGFTDYSELLEFWLDDPEISEKDYVTLCKTIASKLKEIGENFISVPYTRPDVYCINGKMKSNYKGEFAILLINENDTDTWVIDQDFLDNEDWLKDFYYYEIISKFPELENEDFLYWIYNDSSHGANIVIPINFNNVLNAKKYIEFTKQWFSSNEITESAWGEMRKRSAGNKIRREDLPEQDKEHWWRNIELPNPPKWKKEELKGLELAYNIVDKIRTTFNVKWPEQIVVHFDGEPYWDLTIEHITPYGTDSYSMYAHGNSSPWQVYFSKMTLNEKRSIRYRLENKKFYVYPLKYAGGTKTDYHLREDSNYKGEKGIELK